MSNNSSDIRKGNIQIVDDASENLDVLVSILSQDGYEVRPAIDGETALASAREYLPDLILLDIIMPGMSGFEVCEQLKADKRTCHIPVLFISALHETENKISAFEAGGVDYITKPFEKAEVLARVRTHLEIKTAHSTLKKALQEKEQANVLMKAVWQGIPDTVVAVGENLDMIASNRNLVSVSDKDKGLCGTPFEADTDTCACRQALFQTLETRGAIREHQVRCFVRPDGEKVEVINTRPLRDWENRFMGAVIVIRDVTRLTRLEDALSERQSYGNIIGKSDAMKKVFSLLQQIAEVDINVLITGESGTGKELVAEALHYGSLRSGGPLVKVNCAALPDNLLQSELLGHVRGAFTGAINNRRGRIRNAQGGTLFLDEIGDISPQMQLQLLRFLETKEYERVGESQTRKADVRVVAVTNCDLAEKVRQGTFRQDLYYRLVAIAIELPPLKERTEDIPLLCHHFIRDFSNAQTKYIAGLSDTVKRKLMAHPWPGNVRELKNIIQYACTVCPGELIHESDLPPYFTSALSQTASLKKTKYTTRTSEKKAILQMLEKVDWNKAKAARMLGIGRATLYNKLKRYGIKNRKRE